MDELTQNNDIKINGRVLKWYDGIPVVYFLGFFVGDILYCKIGISNNVRTRYKKMQNTCPEILHILGIVIVERTKLIEAESFVHDLTEKYVTSARNEWRKFKNKDQILSFINLLESSHGIKEAEIEAKKINGSPF